MGRKKRKKDWANVSKPPELKERMEGVSLGKDDKGYFVYTHRCRSDSYASPEKIPKAKIKFIESTGAAEFPLSIRASEEKQMPFPGRYRKALKKRTKTLTLRIRDEQDKYKVDEVYEASTYGGEPWGIKIKVLDINTMPRKDVHASYKDLEDMKPDDLVDVIRIEVLKPEKKKKEAALISEAQDPIRQTADSMLKIIIFLLFRVPVKSKRNFLNRVRGKLQHLSPADISMKHMPPTAAIGQAVGITKNILAGLNPFFVKRVIDELTKMMHMIPTDHHLPAAPSGLHPELQPQPKKGALTRPPLSKRAMDVVIEPFDPAVQAALAHIKEKHRGLLDESKVEKIVVHPGGGSHFGEVRSGPGENPRWVHLFKGRIEAEARKWVAGDAPADALAKALEYAIVGTLSHEAGHMKSNMSPQDPFHGEGRAEEKARETLQRVYPQGLATAAIMLDNLRLKLVPSAPFAEPDLAFMARVAAGDREGMERHAMRIFREGSVPAVIELQQADDFNRTCMRRQRIGKILGLLSHLTGVDPCEADFSSRLAEWQAGNDLEPTGLLDDITVASARAKLPSFREFPRNFGVVWMGKLYRGGQPDSLAQVAAMRDMLGVQRIVSLNEDMPELASWCDDLNLEHVQASLGGGYPDEEGWSVIGPDVAGFLTQVPTFVHCRHGMDRTGGVVAAGRADRGWPCDLAYREAKSYGFKDMFVDMVDNIACKCQHDPKSHRHPPFDTGVVRRVLEQQQQDEQPVLDATPADIHYTGLGSSMDDFGYDSGALTTLNPFSRSVPHALPGGGGR